jgi:hypothetical protein
MRDEQHAGDGHGAGGPSLERPPGGAECALVVACHLVTGAGPSVRPDEQPGASAADAVNVRGPGGFRGNGGGR